MLLTWTTKWRQWPNQEKSAQGARSRDRAFLQAERTHFKTHAKVLAVFCKEFVVGVGGYLSKIKPTSCISQVHFIEFSDGYRMVGCRFYWAYRHGLQSKPKTQLNLGNEHVTDGQSRNDALGPALAWYSFMYPCIAFLYSQLAKHASAVSNIFLTSFSEATVPWRFAKDFPSVLSLQFQYFALVFCKLGIIKLVFAKGFPEVIFHLDLNEHWPRLGVLVCNSFLFYHPYLALHSNQYECHI